MQAVQNYDADFAIKADAYAELKQIREHLDDLENASPETKSKLSQSLASIKEGSLGAIDLLKGAKETDELVVWLIEKAAQVGTVLAASGLL